LCAKIFLISDSYVAYYAQLLIPSSSCASNNVGQPCRESRRAYIVIEHAYVTFPPEISRGTPDLDSRENIEAFVELFYKRVLADAQLAPIFLDVAAIDLAVHLPHIKDYWCKLLLGEKGYRRHTMNIHRQLHGRQPLQPGDFQRWLALFNATLDENFAGEGTERARRVATAIAANMESSLASIRRD
jgi:hemoglobin